MSEPVVYGNPKVSRETVDRWAQLLGFYVGDFPAPSDEELEDPESFGAPI